MPLFGPINTEKINECGHDDEDIKYRFDDGE
jgi:hypothetical protein